MGLALFLKEMTRFLDDCDHPAVKANIDISHLVLADVSPSELTCLKDRAAHVHISDCDGKVHGDLPPRVIQIGTLIGRAMSGAPRLTIPTFELR